MKRLIIISCILVLVACKQEEAVVTPSIVINESPVHFSIKSEGELEAVKSTALTAPAATRRPQTLAWILPQFSAVKKGDVVARFDGTSFQLEAEESAYEIQKLMYSMMSKDREIDNSKYSFGAESQVIDYEHELAKQFNIDDPLLYTKIEMIDAADNEQFLEAKAEHIDKVEKNYVDKSAAEIEVLESEQKVQQGKLAMNQASLSALEVVAPHDGLFVLEPSWDGSLPEPGKAVFPGGKLGSLPDLSEMQAKIFVPEVEAIGIKEGLVVSLHLHAKPDLSLTGEVTSISKTAQPKERDNPVKYFTVMVNINEQNPEVLKPGQRLSAVISVIKEPKGLVVPIQTIFRLDGAVWVYLQEGKKFVRQPIETGFCSATLCTVTKGLKGGQIIALSEPDEGKGSERT
ncbi:efflux RND transporter periplasmic adaptor subunit [Marinicella rhabdoformis]|uniref:efflux RND transporter periplasmic adaptor subunit n=1 Tax=Marinicella rhabdoformis TaxID=2580566 RepID=UPI0012AECC3A|nr:efflux RND transporter periplasmic adaptor subunit [Marinicella rhabdoformis]